MRRLAGELATQDYSILRVLLAILYRAVDDLSLEKSEVIDAWQKLREGPEIFWTLVSEYLEEVEHRF